MIDIANKKFNYLTAQRPLFLYKREWVWLCICDCGNEVNIRISKLNNGTTKSCGCFKKKNLDSHKSGKNHRFWGGYKDISGSFFSRIKASAKLRKIEFNVSMEYLWDLFNKQRGLCAYTGCKIFLPINVKNLRGKENELVASLDRIDSSQGYVEGNLQWICKRTNYMKHTMKEDYFLNWIKLIYENKELQNINKYSKVFKIRIINL